jgi:integrase
MRKTLTGRPNTGSIKTKIRTDKNGAKKTFVQAVFRFINEKGAPAEVSKVTENVTEARKWIRYQQDLANNNGIKAIRFQQVLFEQYAAEFSALNIVPAKRTPDGKLYGGRKSYSPVVSQIKSLTEFFGKFKVIDIEYDDLVRYKNWRIETPIVYKNGSTKTRKPATVKRELALLSKMFNTLKRAGKLPFSPFERGETILPSAEIETERLRVLSPDEEENLFIACDTVKSGRDRKHIKPLLTFAIKTGMRRSEIRAVRWDDIDFEENTIHVCQQNTKTERPREIPIEPTILLPLLLKMKSEAKSDHDTIFCKLPKSCRKPFETACRIAKIEDLRFHDLRATFISRAIERNVSPEIVRKVSGHKQDRAFQRYLRFSKRSLNEAFYPSSVSLP